MPAACFLPEEPLPDFHARISRVRAGRSLAGRKGNPQQLRTLGVLAAALALPAMTMPEGLAKLTSAPAPAETVAPMGFETPGESFPGSAFYYLEDVPLLVGGEDAAGADLSASADEIALTDPAAMAADSSPFIVGPAARSLRLAGTFTDRSRAQQCLTQAIYYEAASESDAGQRAVAQVVLNRVAHPSYPSTVCGVVFQGSERKTGCQFTFTCDGALARKPSAFMWGRASRIARQALAGAVYAPVGLATHYHTLAVHPYWADSLDKVAVIGFHQFYRWRGAAGTSAAFISRYHGGEPVPGRNAALVAEQEAGPAPDPVAPPVIGQFLPDSGLAPVDAPAAAVLPSASPPAQATEPAASPGTAPAGAAGSRLPGGGGIRAEYARSGQWRGGQSAGSARD